MASPAWDRVWQPRTLSDRRNDISTIKIPRNAAGLVPFDVAADIPGIIELAVDSGAEVRRVKFAVPSVPGPRWLTPTMYRVGKLLSLPHNWDRQGASPIDSASIQAAMDALSSFMSPDSAPAQWTPTQRSGVQLDWHERGVDLEIAFEPGDSDGYAIFNDESGDHPDWEGPVNDRLFALRGLFRERLTF